MSDSKKKLYGASDSKRQLQEMPVPEKKTTKVDTTKKSGRLQLTQRSFDSESTDDSEDQTRSLDEGIMRKNSKDRVSTTLRGKRRNTNNKSSKNTLDSKRNSFDEGIIVREASDLKKAIVYADDGIDDTEKRTSPINGLKQIPSRFTKDGNPSPPSTYYYFSLGVVLTDRTVPKIYEVGLNDVVKPSRASSEANSLNVSTGSSTTELPVVNLLPIIQTEQYGSISINIEDVSHDIEAPIILESHGSINSFAETKRQELEHPNVDGKDTSPTPLSKRLSEMRKQSLQVSSGASTLSRRASVYTALINVTTTAKYNEK
ncbi:UNVERIFIED_CONTAM: hypothetical protein HDU68_009350, partial [Siphonaria sp. JEL0065]